MTQKSVSGENSIWCRHKVFSMDVVLDISTVVLFNVKGLNAINYVCLNHRQIIKPIALIIFVQYELKCNI